MPKCFIITPYGQKKDASGKTINFDEVFNALIEKIVSEAGLEAVRSDKDLESGPIFRKMIHDIATAEFCIADITTLNPNVFYELGIRHALCPAVTILIRMKAHPLPFDISNLRVFAYGPPGSKEFDEARDQIVKAIRYARNQDDPDSLVFHALPDLSVRIEKPKSIDTIRKKRFALNVRPSRRMGLIGGNLAEVRGVSVWVNPENTDMQMSRYHEATVSGTIRYHGATKNPNGRVKEDLIANDLKSWMRKHKSDSVMPGTVVRTVAGNLESYGVKFVLHVAAVHAVPGRGYYPFGDVRGCVKNVLRRLDQEKADFPEKPASILLPLLGTGAGGGKVEDLAPILFRAAIEYLEDTADSIIETVWFLALSEQQWNACMKTFEGLMDRLQSD